MGLEWSLGSVLFHLTLLGPAQALWTLSLKLLEASESRKSPLSAGQLECKGLATAGSLASLGKWSTGPVCWPRTLS